MKSRQRQYVGSPGGPEGGRQSPGEPGPVSGQQRLDKRRRRPGGEVDSVDQRACSGDMAPRTHGPEIADAVRESAEDSESQEKAGQDYRFPDPEIACGGCRHSQAQACHAGV